MYKLLYTLNTLLILSYIYVKDSWVQFVLLLIVVVNVVIVKHDIAVLKLIPKRKLVIDTIFVLGYLVLIMVLVIQKQNSSGLSYFLCATIIVMHLLYLFRLFRQYQPTKL
jgi:hypothetical protein